MGQRRCAFIFIGGVQPKKTKLESGVRTCPACGLPAARLVRLDNYLSLFFVPLFPLKKGQVVLECGRCGAMSDPGGESGGGDVRPSNRCPGCGGKIEPGFGFCPHCGARLK